MSADMPRLHAGANPPAYGWHVYACPAAADRQQQAKYILTTVQADKRIKTRVQIITDGLSRRN